MKITVEYYRMTCVNKQVLKVKDLYIGSVDDICELLSTW